MKKSSKYLISMIIACVLMFVWIFLTVILTGGRETYEFTKQDKSIFLCFIFVEIITLSVMFISLVKYTKSVKPKMPLKQVIPQTRYEKILKRRGVFLIVVSFLLVFVCQLIGITSVSGLTVTGVFISKRILLISCLIAMISIALQLLLSRHFINHLNDMNVEEQQQYILKHREHAEKISSEKKIFVKNCRYFSRVCSVVYFILGFLISFNAGINYNEIFNTMFLFASAILVLSAFSRIQFPVPEIVYEEGETFINPKDYPELYNLAYKAANTLKCNGKIKIFLNNDFNVGISQVRDIYSIQLGVVLMNLLSKEELYTIFLHEFAHIDSERYIRKEFCYNDFIVSGGNQHFFSGLVSAFYSYVDVIYAFHFMLYKYASSLLSELEADKLMVQYGDVNHAASALLKTRYHDLYEWEEMTYSKKNLFEDSNMPKKIIEKEIDEIKKVYNLKSRIWNQLVQKEILSRTASHPTTKMRIDAMGIKEPITLESLDVVFQGECQKAAAYISKLIYEKNIGNYEENRKMYYLDPFEKVKKWEGSGKTVTPEEYAEVVESLRGLGRVEEAISFCDRVIEELSPVASTYARFVKGCFLLRSYDAEGLEYVYDAIASNSNYIEEGLEVIGNFCCITGNQEELDNYRQKAIGIAQKQKDMYSELSILRPKDQIVPEELPKELKENTVNYITSIENNFIQNIYLVRKIITEDFFTSVFIIRFQDDASSEIKENILRRIFFYLDTCSEWQFSLYEYSEVKKVKFEKVERACIYSLED